MNINDGSLHRLTDEQKKELEKQLITTDSLVPVFEDQMTTKQAETKQVSKHDYKSELGKLRQSWIKKIGRNNPCPCGSGLKYKKCCLK